MNLWVTSREEDRDGLVLWGEILGPGYGFGSASQRGYEGKMMAIEVSSTKTIFEGDVAMRHSSREGFRWILQPTEPGRQLSLPFLLTSNLEYSIIYICKVQIHLNELAQSDDPAAFDRPIPLRDKFGSLVAILDECSPNDRDHLVGRLIVFATKCPDGFRVVGTEWDLLEVEGTLGVVEKQDLSP